VFERHGAVVEGKALIHLVRQHFRVLAQHVAERLPRLSRVVDLLSIQRCTGKRHTDRLMAHGWCSCASSCVAVRSTQDGVIRGIIPRVFRRSFHQPQDPVESGLSYPHRRTSLFVMCA
jgi:hypothetical protein